MEVPIVITSDMLVDKSAGLVDFERGMGYAPPGTLALIALLVAVFFWQLATGALQSQAGLVDAGALVRNRVLEGEPSARRSTTGRTSAA